MKKSAQVKFKAGIIHLGIIILVLFASVVLIFGVLKKSEKGEAEAFPIGQIHANNTVVYGWGTGVQSSQIKFTSTNVQGANGAQVDRVRYYLINPSLAAGHQWGSPDWCSIPSCDPSGYTTYLIGDSSNASNNYEFNWTGNSLQPESPSRPRYLNTASLQAGNYTIAIRVEDVNGNVTGNASSIGITLSQSQTPPPVLPSPSPSPISSPLPSPSPSPSFGLKINTSQATVIGLPGVKTKAFDLTSTISETYELMSLPMWRYGQFGQFVNVLWESNKGNINPGQTIPINVIIGTNVLPGVYDSPTVNMKDSNGVYQAINTKLVVRVLNPSQDSDADTFSNSSEYRMGTDMLDNCSNNSAHAAWPPDFNNDKAVSGSDIFAVIGKIGSGNPRYDLNGDGGVTAVDTKIVMSYFGKTCQ